MNKKERSKRTSQIYWSWCMAISLWAVLIAIGIQALNQSGSSMTTKVDIGGVSLGSHNTSLGEATAPIAVEVFIDYSCETCREVAAAVIEEVKDPFIANGKVKVIYRMFPQTEAAVIPALAAYCAASQDAFWRFQEHLFAHPDHEKYTMERAVNDAQMLGMDPDAFARCLQSETAIKYVEADFRLGRTRQIHSLPAFFVNEQSVAPTPESITKAIREELKLLDTKSTKDN